MTAIAAMVIGPEGQNGVDEFSPTSELCDVDESMCNLSTSPDET